VRRSLKKYDFSTNLRSSWGGSEKILVLWKYAVKPNFWPLHKGQGVVFKERADKSEGEGSGEDTFGGIGW